ncbi:C40 family peptidase [Streptomyces huasconensis]|uniref:C40 family peptidase n=1 Tax=Streptomyces huasconensis TaxID=1854574 RepID=UPI0036F726F2
MRTPEFTEEIPADCACAFCAGAAGTEAGGGRHGGRRARCAVRGAVAAAVGAAAVIGASTTAAAEPAPSHAGWDGSKYWYQDATGWWRWTSHYDKYLRHTGGSASGADASGVTHTAPSPSSAGHNPDPTFRGRAGWDATDRVYWYQQGGSWWWTSHQWKYEARTGRSGSTAGTDSPASSSRSRAGHADRGSHGSHGTEAAISWAMGQLGKPYIWGGNGPDGYDCSGLVQQAYRRAGISLPRVADAQYRAATKLSRSQLRRGDLVFWSSNGSSSGIHHVAIYLGGGQYLEAPRPGKSVRISSFSYYNPTLYGRVG